MGYLLVKGEKNKIKCVLRLVIPGVGQGAHSARPELFLGRGGKRVFLDSKRATQKLRRRTLWALEAGEGPQSGHSRERRREEAYRHPPAWFSLLSARCLFQQFLGRREGHAPGKKAELDAARGGSLGEGEASLPEPEPGMEQL